MQKLFNNILLAIGPGAANAAAIEGAKKFSRELECNLHLLVEKKHTEKKIAEYVLEHEIDLVFVKEEKRQFPFFVNRLNVNTLAASANCPVLSVKSLFDFQKQKIIVLPIGKSLPISKIRVVIYLAKHFNAAIHLVVLARNEQMYEELAYMKKAFQVFKDNTDLPVVCKTLEGEALGNSAVAYAHAVDAGLIVVNPGEESLLSGFINRLFSRFVFNESRVPVMTVL
jgi:hypothetical protein